MRRQKRIMLIYTHNLNNDNLGNDDLIIYWIALQTRKLTYLYRGESL